MTEETVVLGAERDRLIDEMREVAGEIASIDESNPIYRQKAERGHELERHVEGLDWAIRPEEEGGAGWGEDAEFVFQSLGLGRYGRLQDRLEDIAEKSNDPVGSGAARNYAIAEGLVDAPFLDRGEDGDRDVPFEEKLAAVGGIDNAPFGLWAEWRINEIGGVSGNESPRFADLVAESRANKTSGTPD